MYRKVMHLLYGTALLLAMITTTVVAQGNTHGDSSRYYTPHSTVEKQSFFDLGMGFVIASGYTDALKDANPDRTVSGGGGWIYLDAGFAINVSKALYLTPKLELLGTFIEYENSYGLPSSLNSKKATMIFLPGVGGRYDLSSKPSCAYVTADLSLDIPASDLESPKVESGGLAIGVSFGYTFNHEFSIAIMYRNVPVDMNGVGSNLGGVGFAFWREFPL